MDHIRFLKKHRAVAIGMPTSKMDRVNFTSIEVKSQFIRESNYRKRYRKIRDAAIIYGLHRFANIILRNDDGRLSKIRVAARMVSMPMRVQYIFYGFVGHRLERRFNLRPELDQLRIHKEDAIVAHESGDIAHSRLRSGTLKDVDILGELLHFDLDFAQVRRLLLRQLCMKRRRREHTKHQASHGKFVHEGCPFPIVKFGCVRPSHTRA